MIAAFEAYLQLEKKYSPHTVLAYVRDVQAFAEFLDAGSSWEVGTQPEFDWAKVDYADVRAWQIALVEQGLNPLSVNRKMASLKAFFAYQLRIGQLAINPMSKYRAMKAPKKLQLAFSEVEMEELKALLPDKSSVESFRDRLILELFYTLGLRRAELLQLQIGDVRWNEGLVKVHGKRNKVRLVPLLPYLAEDFNAYLQLRAQIGAREKWLFLSDKGVKLNATFVYRLVIRYLSRVSEKLKKSPHILRHTFATHLLNQGAAMNSVKELLGHSSLASTQVYTQTSLEVLRQTYAQAHPRNQK